MNSLRDAPLPALEMVANATPDAWVVTRPGALGLMLAFLDVTVAESAQRFSFSVTGWTYEEICQRIERVRWSAARRLRAPVHERRRSSERA